ncbi:TrmH family RNA methyltransferase [Georgenia sp. Z1344]|uniref:TrmH family RNA methyltransferase n=1 Tax=Georgenia sp. Z1344 TaxID=3416706 RepID=UPI003CEE3051
MTNPRSERVRRVAALSGRSARSRHGQFLVEGPQAVRELMRFAPERVRDVYVAEDAALQHHDVVEAALEAGVYLHEATAEVVRAMSPDAQGVLAVANIERTGRRAGAGAAAGAARRGGGDSGHEASSVGSAGHDDTPSPTPDLASVVASGPRLVALLVAAGDPGNAGTVIRSADAAGADAVLMGTGSVEVTNPKVVRATAGSLFHLPVVGGVEVEAAVSELRAAGMQVLAADGAGDWDLDELADRALAQAHGLQLSVEGELAATDLLAPDLAAPTVWLVGNEAHGLTAAQRSLADAVVRVPVHGAAESLNLATAAALCLYASARAQRREV